VLILLAAANYFLVGKVTWIGNKDLEVEFVISDAITGFQVPNASLAINGIDNNGNDEQFILQTDVFGIARRLCPKQWCSGTDWEWCGIPVSGSSSVKPPDWVFQATAPGYVATEWVSVRFSDPPRSQERVRPGLAKLTVPVSLRPLEAGGKDGQRK
jgi:hypothetical protein